MCLDGVIHDPSLRSVRPYCSNLSLGFAACLTGTSRSFTTLCHFRRRRFSDLQRPPFGAERDDATGPPPISGDCCLHQQGPMAHERTSFSPYAGARASRRPVAIALRGGLWDMRRNIVSILSGPRPRAPGIQAEISADVPTSSSRGLRETRLGPLVFSRAPDGNRPKVSTLEFARGSVLSDRMPAASVLPRARASAVRHSPIRIVIPES